MSPLRSASEYASSSPLCCQRNQHLALDFPTRYRPILLTRSMWRIVGFDIAQHTCIDANLRSGRSCDKKLIRATSALYRVMSPFVSAWLSGSSSSATCGRSLSSLLFALSHLCPVWVCPCPRRLSPLPSSLLFTAVAERFARCNSRPFSISLMCLWSASIVIPSRFHSMTRFSILPLSSCRCSSQRLW